MKRNKQITIIIAFIFISIYISSCKKENDTNSDAIEYDGSLYFIENRDFPLPINHDKDNPMTKQGVLLGKMLFYEKMLSKDGSMTCASCHNQNNAFDDTAKFSTGVRKLKGGRQAMAIFNMAWNTNNFFWDGRAELLRHQSVLPIQDALEMDETIENVIKKLRSSDKYKNQFVRSFKDGEISEKSISFALEQFMNSIVSNQSKYDDYLGGKVKLADNEERGRILFFKEYNKFFPKESGADCAHCHGGFNFENDRYMNNGLDNSFSDSGRSKVTKNMMDVGKFKVVSLRNIELTPPYMHDGRFKTLEEVVNHYNNGLMPSATLDQALEQTRGTGLMLTDQNKKDLVAFLKTLTDKKFTSNSEYSDPN